jgi:hypothetical protein
MAGNLDVDGDGKPDLVIGAYGENQREGAVYVFSHTGQLRYRLANHQGPFSYFGITILSIGDADQDGCGDFVVGHLDAEGRGTHTMVSGKTARTLSTGRGQPGDGLWQSADAAGDVDRDGVPDYIVGNRYGLVRVFSGRTGGTIWRWAQPRSSFGSAVAGGGVDQDRDGVPDLLVVAQNHNHVFVYSGRDGSQLHYLWLQGLNNTEHAALALPPQPGSPFGMFLISQPAHHPSSRLALYRGSPAGSDSFGQSCAGTLSSSPKIGLRSLPPPADDVRFGNDPASRVHLSDAEPGSPAVLLLGLSRTTFAGKPLPIALSPLGFAGCSLFTSIDEAIPVTVGAAGKERGYGWVDLTLATPGLSRFTLHGQWLVLGTGATWPGGVSDALSWRH